MLPTETLLDILASLNRRDFDVLELVNRALGSLIISQFNDAPRRLVSLMFFEEGRVMLISPSDGWRRVPVVELPEYLPRSVVTKMVFKAPYDAKTMYSFTEEMYQALLPCRAHFAADAMCDFHSLSWFPPSIFHKALDEVFVCSSLVFAEPAAKVMQELRHVSDEQDLAALPCFASCTNLQIVHDTDVFSDANGALEWLLGTHGVASGGKHLSITNTCSGFLVAFVDAIEQQFIHATTPASFNVELLCFVGHSPTPAVGTTRELENVDTNEQLKVVVDTDVRKPNGEPAFKTKVIIRRKPTA
ncbi:hypothetical protein AAVH_19683 [Aphelenchoides avenae]|nr:hypothetical protein AAVH_19683 [Aphelenchus avenae]